VIGCTGVDGPVRRRWSQRHGVVGGGEGGRVPANSERGPWCRGRWSHRRERRWSAVRWHVVGRWRSQESQRRCRRTGGAGGLTRPHGDGVGPGVVDRRATGAATPAGETATRGVAAPTSALAGRRPPLVVECGRGARGGAVGAEHGPWSTARGMAAPPPPRRCLGARGGAVEGRCLGGSLEGHGELLKEKLTSHGMEGGERHGPLDQSLQVAITGAEATQEVQHQGTVCHWLTEIAEGVHQTFHLAVVLLHGEVPLGELVELSVEV
jgi:hypothetical protein